MKRKIDFEKRVWLCEKFGSRVSFNRTERKLYGHDIAAMPSLFKPLIGNTTPEAVVQPETEAEIVELVRWAVANNIPLTPRAKASSGYGGAIPVKQGVVVDFYRMKRILRIDSEARIATVEAGVVWEALDNELAKHGLTLRLYPTQLPVVYCRRLGWLRGVPGSAPTKPAGTAITCSALRWCCLQVRCASSRMTSWILLPTPRA